jgi:hypothetical protein
VTLALRRQEHDFANAKSSPTTRVWAQRVCWRRERNNNSSSAKSSPTTRTRRREFNKYEFANDKSATTRVRRRQVCRQQHQRFIRFRATTDTPYFESFNEFKKDILRSFDTRLIPCDKKVGAQGLFLATPRAWARSPRVYPVPRVSKRRRCLWG